MYIITRLFVKLKLIDLCEKMKNELQVKEYGQSWEIVVALWNRPKTLQEIVDHFYSYIRLMGLLKTISRMDRRHNAIKNWIEGSINVLINRGWITRDGERYALTSLGCEEAKRPLDDMHRMRLLLNNMAQPQTASKVGVAVHFCLAAFKLPAALISGSVGLLNDATDTLLDGISSILVYFGIKFKRERTANVVLVLLMLATGSATFYGALRRFFIPIKPQVDWFTFLAAILSAIICGILYLYQRIVGIRNGSLTLIAQSVDSRNHVIVAISVMAGLIATLFNFPLLDTVVGFIVTILILKSAIELAVETFRSLGEESVDLSRYKIGIAGWYEKLQQDQMCDWMLYLVGRRSALTKTDLSTQSHEAFDLSNNPMLKELGVNKLQNLNEMVEKGIQTLYARGWLNGAEPLSLSDTGKARLEAQIYKKGQARWWLQP